jgi:uncharacterized protein YcbX
MRVARCQFGRSSMLRLAAMADTRCIGRVEAIFRYPVKSMAGERLASTQVGWYGVDGDRRFAVLPIPAVGGKPWLTATKLPQLLRFTPVLGSDGQATHVRAPGGRELAVDGPELVAEIERLHGKPVQVIRLDNGHFDETNISVITQATIDEIEAACGHVPDVRRFRPNILLRTEEPRAFEEDSWVGTVLEFGDDGAGPHVSVTMRDLRCAMLNLDPDSAHSDPQVMKTVVRMNENTAGVYATVIRCGLLSVGQRVYLRQRPA